MSLYEKYDVSHNLFFLTGVASHREHFGTMIAIFILFGSETKIMKRSGTFIIIVIFWGCFFMSDHIWADSEKEAALPPEIPVETGIQTIIEGVDDFETRVIFPQQITQEQLDFAKYIIENNASIFRQRLTIEQQRIHSEVELEYLRIFKNLLLWGVFLSIPLSLTVYWIFKNLSKEYRALQQQKFDYKLKELESAERQIALSEK